MKDREFRLADPERIAPAFRERLELAHGRWDSSDGTAYSPEGWFQLLLTATLSEAVSLEHMVELSRFAFAWPIGCLTSGAREALDDESAPKVLRYIVGTVSWEAVASSELANRYLRVVRHHFRDTMALRGKRVMFPLRAALVGSLEGPCLGTVTSLLGANRCKRRLMDVLTCFPETV